MSTTTSSTVIRTASDEDRLRKESDISPSVRGGVNHEALLALWGAQRVVRFDPDGLRAAPIPKTARQFLADVGLPWRIWHVFTVEAGVDLDDANEAPPSGFAEIEVRSTQQGPAVRIGWDYGDDVCILASGEVWTVPPDQSNTRVLVNTNVGRLAESLFLFSQDRTSRGASEDEIEGHPSEFEEHRPDEEITIQCLRLATRLCDLDPRAWAPEQWWPLVLESHCPSLVLEPGWPMGESVP